jgi:MFS transporter, Spinster family, sphingosine-1-phosphate transporter
VEEKQYKVGRGSAYTILIVLSLLQLLDWADRSILSIALQSIKQTFNLTDTQAGMLPSLLQFGVVIMTVPVSMLADRWARRKVIAIMDIVWSVFTLFTGLGTQLWHLLLARFMVGAGEAGYAPAGQTWLGVVFPKEMRSRIFGVFMMFNPIGLAIGLLVGGALIGATHDWRVPFYVFGIPGLLLAIWVFFLPDYKVEKQKNEALFSKAYFKEWGEVFKIKSWWCITLAQVFMFFMFFAISSWVPALVMRAFNMKEAAVGLTLGLLGFLFLVAPLGGLLADKWMKRSKNGRVWFSVVVSILALVASLFAFSNMNLPFYSWLAIYAAYAVLSALVQPANQTVMHDVLPIRIRATGFSTQLLIAQLFGGMTGPFVVGLLSDKLGGGVAGLQGGLFIASLAAIFGIIMFAVLAKYYPADSARVSDAVMAEK